MGDKASKTIPPLPDAYTMAIDIWDTPPKDAIRWFDNQVMEYVYFNNHEERGRYILKQFGVPDEWTDTLMKTFPNKKWTVITIQMFVYFLDQLLWICKNPSTR